MKSHTLKNIRILQKRKGEGREIISGAAGIITCPKCHAVYFKKSWHGSAGKLPGKGTGRLSTDVKLCPACTMIKGGLYEGIVTIKNTPLKRRTEIIGLVENFCSRAEERDPMDRLIAIKRDKNLLTITTTENQLAHKLAKHIVKSFKGSRALTLYGKNDNVTVRIEITFPRIV